ncbi:N-acetylmuramoyl-L-alanine amidase [Edaphobacter sp. DSM 109919]|uniref:N-acetylmuramoyl-L-alanine amidase n=1 Tax=Edaphobacter paludis TaxID=3035702 RepID=A0AAU7CYN9_9BACT
MRPHLLLIAAILLLLARPTVAQHEVERCNLAIDIGHTETTQGSTSARGVGEYLFNRTMANLLLDKLHRDDRVDAFIIDGNDMTLQQRTQFAADHHATVFFSLHHDSVQPRYLSTWTYQGKEHHYSAKFHGFSLFISEKNPYPKQSLALAQSLGTQLLAAGFTPTLHHAEKIPGESRPLLDPHRGIYAFDDLIVLKTASMPAVLLECGVIVNRSEELHLTDPKKRARMIQAVATAIERTCPRISLEDHTPTTSRDVH